MAKGKYTDNPCITIDKFGKPHLKVILHFFYDKTLPKWNGSNNSNIYDKAIAAEVDGKDDNDTVAFGEWERLRREHSSSSYYYTKAMGEAISKVSALPRGFWDKIKDVFKKNAIPAEKILPEIKEAVRAPDCSDQLVAARESASKLLILLQQSGQTSQAETLKDKIYAVSAEIAALNNGYGKYLTEQDMIDFMLKAEKGVVVTFLQDYSGLLPLDIAKKKIEVDKLKIFDNYCIAHFNKDISPFRFIEAKIVEQKEHDPILFGMIEGSDKLYYIADWTVEDDDLTLDKVEESLGRKARSVGDSDIATSGRSVNWLIEHEKEIEEIIGKKPDSSAKE